MIEVTWDYGSRLNAKVDMVDGNVVVCGDENGHGHIIVNADHDVEPVAGREVVLEFCQGGPRGGYWKIVSERSKAS